MTILNSGPCEAWDITGCDPWPDGTEGIRDIALMAATEALWARTHRRFGTCQVTLRPCKQECWTDAMASWIGGWLPTWGGSSGWGWPYPALVGGRWYNMGCGMCGDTCSCTTLHQIALPYPVADIIEVKVDGQVMVTGSYRVDDWRYLVRLDGEQWPWCNDLNLDDDQEGTWSVTATYGEAVPELGKFAVNQLGREIAKACAGSGGCALPTATVKQIQRQGVTKELVQGLLIAGFSGLPAVNLFLDTYNPARSGVASIFDIDGKRTRRVGT